MCRAEKKKPEIDGWLECIGIDKIISPTVEPHRVDDVFKLL